jgi:hypothetical protein
MYLGPNAALCEALPTLENALLWTMRAWVIGRCYNRDTAGRIDDVFHKLGVAAGARHLDGFMTALSRGALRSLEVNCVCHPAVSDDEAALLEIFALQQQERHEGAFEVLAAMATEVTAIDGCDSANRLVIALGEAGHDLALRLPASNRFAPLPQDVFDGPRLRYLH